MTWILVGLVLATAAACLYNPTAGRAYEVTPVDWLRIQQLKTGKKIHPSREPDRPPVI